MSHEYTPYPFIKWAIDHIGLEALEELQRKWNKPKHLTNDDLREMCSVFDRKLEELGACKDYEQKADKRWNEVRRKRAVSGKRGAERNADVPQLGEHDEGEGNSGPDEGQLERGPSGGLDLPTLRIGSESVP